MNNKTICHKVTSMLSLYIDDRLSEDDKDFIKTHLQNCPICRKKYLYLKSLIKNLKDSYKQIIELSEKKQKRKTFSIREHQLFVENISQYVDSELSPIQSYEFRKYLMKSKPAQNELKNMYSMQKQLRNAYNITRKEAPQFKIDDIIKPLKKNKTSFFDSVILEQLLSVKTAKIAILAGIIMFSTYGAMTLYSTIKSSTKQIVKTFIEKITTLNSGYLQ